MSLVHKTEYLFLKILLFICKILPITWSYKLFNLFGILGFYILKKRRVLSLKNLHIAFPKKSPKEIKIIARRAFQNLSETACFNLLVISNKLSKSDLNHTIQTEGWKKFKTLTDKSNKGVLIITSHIGNWEAMSQFTSINLTKNLNAIARETNNPLLEEKIINPMRNKFGMNTFHKKNAILKTLKTLHKGDVVGILIDQKLNDPLHIKTNFFNKEAKSTPLPALLQIRHKIPVVHGYLIKISTGKYKLVYEDPVEWDNNIDSEEEQINMLTQIHQNYIEKVIKKYPEQWFWMHDRWNIKKDS